MALINEGASLPSPMWALARLLATEKKPLAVALARSVMSPPSLGDNGSQTFDTALRTLAEYGAVAESGEKIALSPGWADLSADDPREFAELMRRAIFAPERNTQLAETATQEGPRDLTRALCWFLTLDPLGPPVSSTDIERLQDGALPSHVGLPFQNDVRFGRFTFWGPALGFATNALLASDGPRRLAVDCTPAVRGTIARMWKPGQLIDAVEAVAAIRGALPVLPGGKYSTLLGLPSRPENIEPALSFALLCGHDQGWIKLERKADAPRAIQVIDPALSSGTRRVTHIGIAGGSRD
jgi:hypothetical protein